MLNFKRIIFLLLLLFHLKHANQIDLSKSLKWLADARNDWFFQKQNNSSIWTESCDSATLKRNYTQISALIDSDGYPIVVLRCIDDRYYYFIKLSQGLLCNFTINSENCSVDQPGVWEQKPVFDTCGNLPRHCQYIKYETISKSQVTNHKGLMCKNTFDQEMLNEMANMWHGCSNLKNSYVSVSVNLLSGRRKQIVDKSFGVFNLTQHLSTRLRFPIYLMFLNVKGFDIESQISLRSVDELYFYGNMQLFRQNRRVNDCHEFNTSHGFIFTSDYELAVNILQPKTKHSVCSLFFRNASLFLFSISLVVNSYITQNTIHFIDPKEKIENISSLNSWIESFKVDLSYGLVLDSRLLNPAIFENTENFKFSYDVNWIDVNVFRPLTNVKKVFFDPTNLIRLIRKQGIDWMRTMNRDLDVNMTNKMDVSENFDRAVFIVGNDQLEFSLIPEQFAQEQDLCLFAHFPFNQLIIFLFIDIEITEKVQFIPFSCAELWIYQFYPIMSDLRAELYSFITKQRLENANYTACEFKRRFDLCNKTTFGIAHQKESSSSSSSTSFSSFDLMLVLELASLSLIPLISVWVIINSFLTIYVIYHKENVKIMREKHYIYISLHCVSNTAIAVTQILNLMSECQYPVGVFCSSVRELVFVQYVKIVFGEYLNSVCRLVSNFAYLGFSICRMFKVGKDHGAFIKFVSELEIKKFMSACVLASSLMSICKALQFDVNLNQPDYAFPVSIVQNSYRQWVFNPNYVAIMVINAGYDTLNYFVFVLVHLVVDLVLIRKMNSTLLEKEEKLKTMTLLSHALEQTVNENSESKRRLVLMVVLNSVFNLVTKVPLMITSLNDVRLIILKPYYNEKSMWFGFNFMDANLLFRYFCFNQKACLILQNFGNCLFLISLSTTWYFLKHFDKNFANACQQAFPKKKLLFITQTNFKKRQSIVA